MSKLTRRRLLQSAAAVALLPYAAQGAMSVSPVPQSSGGGGPSNLPTTIVIAATTGAIPNNSYVRFGHPFGANDLPSGKILSITDDLSSSVPYTAMARSTGGSGTATRFADNVVRLPNGISAPLNVTSITHSTTTATVTTASNHGLSTGAVVVMHGQAPDDYAGQYTITVTGLTTFTYVMPTTPATNATTAGQMFYTRVLTLNSTSGSWNNTLPNGKTPANIVTDITTNFDNQTLTLSNVKNSAGSTVASGTFNADLATALAATGTAGQLRQPASRQGQLVCDILALMKFNDNVTPTTHLGSMSAWFYVTAFLDQTTGAVQELRSRIYIDNSLANVAMDYYTYNATLKQGSTVVRSTGLSTNASIDGKVQSFLPAAVNTSTGVINIPNHGFVGGETVQLTNSGGALPSGWATATDYGVIWIDGNNIGITPNFGEGNQLGNSSLLIPSTQGTGTHTVTCHLFSAFRSRVPYVGADALADRWTGKTGALAPLGDYAVHNNAYLQATKMVPPVDLTINLLTKAAIINTGSSGGTVPGIFALDRFCFGGFGSLQYSQNTGGAGGFHEYGGPWTDKPLRKLRYCADPGSAQTVRVDALMMGAYDISLINDDTLWRMPCVNDGPARNGVAYSGLPTPAVNSCFGQTFQVGFTAATSYKQPNGTTAFYSFSHRYILYPRLYMFEGGQDVHDMMMMDANATILANTAGAGATFPTNAQISAKNYLISGTTYYTWINGGGDIRADAWTLQVYADTKFLGDDGCVEKPYIADLYSDWIFVANWVSNTFAPSVDPNYSLWGGWPFGEIARAGPGNIGSPQGDSITGFFQSYLGETFGHIARMDSANSVLSSYVATFFILVDNMYRANTANGAFGNTYGIRQHKAAGSATGSTLTIANLTDPVFLDSNLSHGGFILYQTNGLIVGCSQSVVVDVYPANGDRHYLTNTDIEGTEDIAYCGPPASNAYQTYFVQNASGSYINWQYSTTNSLVGLISSYPAFNSNTLSAAVTTTGQTTIQTTAALTFPNPATFPLANSYIVIGNEVMTVTAGKGTTTLTVTRGSFGTTASTYSNGATIYVPYTSIMYADYQNRTVAFPPSGHCYRAGGAAGLAPDGYLTMMRSQAFYGYLLGKIVKTAFNNADLWFNDAVVIAAGGGPPAFAASNTLKDSVNTTFTS